MVSDEACLQVPVFIQSFCWLSSTKPNRAQNPVAQFLGWALEIPELSGWLRFIRAWRSPDPGIQTPYGLHSLETRKGVETGVLCFVPDPLKYPLPWNDSEICSHQRFYYIENWGGVENTFSFLWRPQGFAKNSFLETVKPVPAWQSVTNAWYFLKLLALTFAEAMSLLSLSLGFLVQTYVKSYSTCALRSRSLANSLTPFNAEEFHVWED